MADIAKIGSRLGGWLDLTKNVLWLQRSAVADEVCIQTRQDKRSAKRRGKSANIATSFDFAISQKFCKFQNSLSGS